MPRKKKKNITLRALLFLLGSLFHFWVFQVEIIIYPHQFEFGFLVDVVDNLLLYPMFLIFHIKNISEGLKRWLSG